MGVLNDYECMMHGPFEGTSPRCPYNCRGKLVKLVFNKAPSIRGARTTFVDAELKTLANQYGLTDMSNDKEGDSVMSKQEKKYPKEAAGKWIGAGVPWNSPGWSQRGEAPKTFDISALGEKHPVPMLNPVKKFLPKALPTFIRKE